MRINHLNLIEGDADEYDELSGHAAHARKLNEEGKLDAAIAALKTIAYKMAKSPVTPDEEYAREKIELKIRSLELKMKHDQLVEYLAYLQNNGTTQEMHECCGAIIELLREFEGPDKTEMPDYVTAGIEQAIEVRNEFRELILKGKGSDSCA